MASVMNTSTNPAAAALSWNAASGREVQLNIWIGITVKGEVSHSKLRNGGSGLTGAGGRKAMKVGAPMVDDRARLADGARQADDHTGQDAGRGIRQDVVAHGLPLRGTERVGRL